MYACTCQCRRGKGERERERERERENVLIYAQENLHIHDDENVGRASAVTSTSQNYGTTATTLSADFSSQPDSCVRHLKSSLLLLLLLLLPSCLSRRCLSVCLGRRFSSSYGNSFLASYGCWFEPVDKFFAVQKKLVDTYVLLISQALQDKVADLLYRDWYLIRLFLAQLHPKPIFASKVLLNWPELAREWSKTQHRRVTRFVFEIFFIINIS